MLDRCSSSLMQTFLTVTGSQVCVGGGGPIYFFWDPLEIFSEKISLQLLDNRAQFNGPYKSQHKRSGY